MDLAFDQASHNIESQNKSRRDKAKKELEKKRYLEKKKKQLEDKYEEQRSIIREEKRKLQEAQEQRELEALVASQNNVYSRKLLVWIREAEGDRMIMPQSVLEDIHSKQNTGNVMTFKIQFDSEQESVYTHGGVLEFTAEEGTIGLPKKIIRKLGLSENIIGEGTIQVQVDLVSLPKATFVQLEPLNPPAFSKIPDPRAHLQAILSADCTTLTIGDSIAISHVNETQLVRVIDIKPSEAVSLIDTEVEVDLFIPSFVKSGENESGIIEPLVPGRPSMEYTIPSGLGKEMKIILTSLEIESLLKEEKFIEFTVNVNNYWIHGCAVQLLFGLFDSPTIPLNQYKTSIDSKHKFKLPMEVFSSLKEGTPFLLKIQADCAVDNIPDAEVTIQCDIVDDDTDDMEISPNNISENDGSLCSNCKRIIPVHNLQMHEVFCIRNNILCSFDGCNQVIKKNQQDSHCHCEICGHLFNNQESVNIHKESFHIDRTCSQCNSFTDKLLSVRNHQETTCPKKLIKCRFCEDIVFSEGETDDIRDKYYWNLTKHESKCGNKTLPCSICNQNIRIKEMEVHLKIHEDIKLSNTTTPKISSPPSIAIPSKMKEEDNNIPSKTEEMNEIENEVECPICNIKLSSERLLNSHLDTKHFQ